MLTKFTIKSTKSQYQVIKSKIKVVEVQRKMKFTKLTPRVFSAASSTIAKIGVVRPPLSFSTLSRPTGTTSFYSSIVGRVLSDVGNFGKELSKVWGGGNEKTLGSMQQGSSINSWSLTRPAAIDNGPLSLQGKQLLEKFDKLMAIEAPPASVPSSQDVATAVPTVMDTAVTAMAAAESAQHDTNRIGPFTSVTENSAVHAATSSAATAVPAVKKVVPFSANELSMQGGKLKKARKSSTIDPAATVESIAAAASAVPTMKKMAPFSANELSLQGGKLKKARKGSTVEVGTTVESIAAAATVATAAPAMKKMVPFSANELSMQGGKLKKARKSSTIDPAATVGSIAAAATAAFTQQCASSGGNQAPPPRPFSIADISNVRLKSARLPVATKPTAGTLPTSGTTAKAAFTMTDIANVKLRPVKAAPKSGGKVRDANKVQSIHSVMKEALSKKFANTRTSLDVPDSPSAQW
jgi:hypothetical protein